MQNFDFNLKNSIFTKQAIKAAREKAIKKDVQDSTASSNEVKNLLEQKCDNAGVFRDLTDEEVEARLKAEEQSPLSLIKNLINNKHKIDSSASPQNDAFRHTEQSEVSQSIQGDGEILRHFVPQNDVLPTAGAMEDSETVLIPNDGDSGISQPLVTEFTPESIDSGNLQQLETEFTPESVDSGVSQPQVTEFTPNSGDIGISQELETEFTPTPTPVENRANATSSLTIKDADGAKPQTLAAGDKLNVTYVYEGETFNYTIEAKSAQNVTLQTKDGYFTVVGDNLAVQTDDEQYSFVALIGTTNSLKIGTNGKTYNGNSIAYNSAEGGHSIYTWGDPEPDVVLSRGDNEVTLPLTYEEQTVMLTNPFTGQNYTYKIKARDITQYEYYHPDTVDTAYLEAQKTVKLQFLENGRFVITGNYVDITAGDNQVDDLIVIGHFNNIRTGDKDDTVRVGKVVDARVTAKYYIANPTTHAENGDNTSHYIKAETHLGRGGHVAPVPGDTSKDVWAYTAVGNHVDTGEGNDYVTLYFNKNDTNFTVDMGNGDDKLLFSNDAFENYDYSVSWANLSDEQKERISGVELARGKFEDVASIDGNDGWTCQNRKIYNLRDGACITLSLINCISQVRNGGNLSDYADIVDNKNGTYTVTFKNYNPPQGKTNTVTVSKSEFRAVSGDLDSVVFATAIGKLALTNEPALANEYFGSQTKPISESGFVLAYVGNNRTDLLSLYVFGNSNFAWSYINSGSNAAANKQRFLNLASHYLSENGDLSHFIICNFKKNGSGSPELGLDDEHAYTLKDINIEGNYAILINPEDDNDVVRFDIDELLEYNPFVRCYGYTSAQLNAFFNAPFKG